MNENAPRRFHTSTLVSGGDVVTTGGYDFSAASDLTISWSSRYDAANCKPPGIGGIVTGKIAAAPPSVNLTDEGAEDWEYELDQQVVRKAGANQITAAAAMGAPTKT
jgi:hypothetical protein